MAKLPALKELASLVAGIQRQIEPEFRTQEDSEDEEPGILLTIGWNPADGSWNYQTGDTQYQGGAYGYPVWASAGVYENSKPNAVAKELREELKEGGSSQAEENPTAQQNPWVGRTHRSRTVAKHTLAAAAKQGAKRRKRRAAPKGNWGFQRGDHVRLVGPYYGDGLATVVGNVRQSRNGVAVVKVQFADGEKADVPPQDIVAAKPRRNPAPSGGEPSPAAIKLFEKALAKVESESIRQWATSDHNLPIWHKIAQDAVDKGRTDPNLLTISIVATAMGA